MLLLAIDDPKPGIGSGSATLNALLVVTEHLSARAGYTVCLFETTVFNISARGLEFGYPNLGFGLQCPCYNLHINQYL